MRPFNLASMIAMTTLTATLAAGCTPPSDEAAGETPAVETGTEQPSEPASSGDQTSDALALQAMHFDEFSQVIAPGLGCALEGGDAIILVATGPDDANTRSQAAVKIDDAMVLLTAHDPGGYETLTSGGVFVGSGVTATVTTSGEGELSGIESTSWSASVTVTRGEAGLTLPGTWSCGA